MATRFYTSSAMVEINRNPMQESFFGKVQPGLGVKTYADGVALGARGLSETLCRGVIIIDRIDEAKAVELNEFISKTLRFGSLPCSLSADGCDLGYGLGIAISSANLILEDNTKSYIYRIGTFNKFEVRIPYEFWLESTTGRGTRR